MGRRLDLTNRLVDLVAKMRTDEIEVLLVVGADLVSLRKNAAGDLGLASDVLWDVRVRPSGSARRLAMDVVAAAVPSEGEEMRT